MKKIKYVLTVIIFMLSAGTIFPNNAGDDNWFIINGGEFNNEKIIMKPVSDKDNNIAVFTTGNSATNFSLGSSYKDKPCNVVVNNISGSATGEFQSNYCNVQINGIEYVSPSPFNVTFTSYGAVGSVIAGSLSASLVSTQNGHAVTVEIHFAAVRKSDL